MEDFKLKRCEISSTKLATEKIENPLIFNTLMILSYRKALFNQESEFLTGVSSLLEMDYRNVRNLYLIWKKKDFFYFKDNQICSKFLEFDETLFEQFLSDYKNWVLFKYRTRLIENYSFYQFYPYKEASLYFYLKSLLNKSWVKIPLYWMNNTKALKEVDYEIYTYIYNRFKEERFVRIKYSEIEKMLGLKRDLIKKSVLRLANLEIVQPVQKRDPKGQIFLKIMEKKQVRELIESKEKSNKILIYTTR